MNPYEPIWNRIKLKNSASLVTHKDNVKGVIKGLINLKSRDRGYKLMLAEKALMSKLEITREESPSQPNHVILHFSLTVKIKESYIGVNTL